MLATIRDYTERVKQGKEIEWRIVSALRKRLEPRGIKLEVPTNKEDVKDKIDLWVTNPKGRRLSVQVKYRESGDDLIFEIVKNVRLWDDGRDYICRAQLYFFVDRQGTGWLYWTDPIKASVKHLREKAKTDLDLNPCRMQWEDKGWEMKITTDHAHGNDKLMVFFKPTYFPLIERFEKLLI